MTGPAGIELLLAAHRRKGWILAACLGRAMLPLDMRLKRPVAGLATDTHLGHGSMIAVRGCVVIFAQRGVVARGAHAVPIHPAPRPMSPFSRQTFFRAEDLEPFFPARVPSRGERLPSAARRAHQKLDQRIAADHAINLMRFKLAALVGRRYLILPVANNKFSRLPRASDSIRSRKRCLTRIRIGPLFRQTMIRLGPLIVFLPVALAAGL